VLEEAVPKKVITEMSARKDPLRLLDKLPHQQTFKVPLSGGYAGPPVENHPKVDEKAYKAALERIPTPDQKYDPWGIARPFANTAVPPGHFIIEARKVAREICALPAGAVAVSRNLLKLPAVDTVRRFGQRSELGRQTSSIANFFTDGLPC
jgi:hypothetical protein